VSVKVEAELDISI